MDTGRYHTLIPLAQFARFYSAVPMWAVGAIVVVVLVLVACVIFCVFKKCFAKKKKPKTVRERKVGRRRKEKEGEGETGEKVRRWSLVLLLHHLNWSGSQSLCCTCAFTFQEGEVKKEGAEEEKEQEKLGKLEYSLDYNFTEAQVRQHF